MNIKPLLIAGVCILTVACQNKNKDSQKSIESIESANHFYLPDSLSSKRVIFALNLKSDVANRCWLSFGKKRTEGTLIYFNEDQSEVFFPSSQVLKKLTDFNEYSDDYVSASRTDSIPFHMEVMISFNSVDSSQFFFKHPVEQFSSVEETSDYIPSVKSTEMWATMVVHEMFHHFQYNNENFVKYAESVIGILPFDIRNLVTLCQEDEQFLALIQNENKILMKAISKSDKDVRDSLISSYLNGRKKRITTYGAKYPNLEQVENYYIIQEGSARYIEYHSMFILNSYFNNIDAPTIQDDPKFNSYSEFKEIDLGNNVFNYLVYAGSTDYHYTLGFNLMRLLDELKIEYKKDLLNNPEKGLHEYLEDYINTLPKKTKLH
jgi:hypothetical protein